MTNLMMLTPVGSAELVVLTLTLAVIGLLVAIVLGIRRRPRVDAASRDFPPPDLTSQLISCPRCGTLVPPHAPHDLCPRCVLQVGLGTRDDGGPAFRDEAGRPNPPQPEELAGCFPHLEILELLGQGGMGAVYKARQKDLDRLVALKILPGGAHRDPAFAERFTREARALARLSHPNIVGIHDFGHVHGAPETGSAGTTETPAAYYYFIMEFIDGPNLRQLMRGQDLSPGQAMAIVPKICEALQFAHDAGVVHRDIKPENILVDRNGGVKIADFGIAKIVGEQRDTTLTGAHDIIGTPHYMAPEQVEHPLAVDHRADIYSLGVVFYEMLTGELPLGKFDVPSNQVQLDVRLDAVVLRSLAKAPERRYQQADEVKTDVENIALHPLPPAAAHDHIPVPPEAQFSRLALLGALWAPFFFCCGMLLLVSFPVSVPEGQAPPGPAWWQTLLAFTVLPLGLAAPFGTTICGLVALSSIRRSTGKLYGSGLALFDILLFPLLALDILIVWLVFLLMKQSLVWVGFDPGTEPSLDVVLPPAVLILLVVDAWLIRWAASAVRDASPGGRSPEPSPWVWGGITAVLLLGAGGWILAASLDARDQALDIEHDLLRQQAAVMSAARFQGGDGGRSTPSEPSVPASVPPVVIRTLPESGDSQVDPSVSTIRVTFSKPMQDGSWSWGRLDGDTWPETTGPPRFEADGRTCVLPVRLRPGRVYATWINAEDLTHFRDREGNSAIPYLLVIQTKETP